MKYKNLVVYILHIFERYFSLVFSRFFFSRFVFLTALFFHLYFFLDFVYAFFLIY